MREKFLLALTSLESLIIYRKLLQDDIIKSFYNTLQAVAGSDTSIHIFINNYCNFYHRLCEFAPEESFHDYVLNKIVYDDNSFSTLCEKESYDYIDSSMLKIVEHDLYSLNNVINLSARDIKDAVSYGLGKDSMENAIIQNLPEWPAGSRKNREEEGIFHEMKEMGNLRDCVRMLAEFHMKNGSGNFAFYKGFVWERKEGKGVLTGIKAVDPVRFSDLIGYEAERKKIIDNTVRFIKGLPANNVLLYGDRGTGKSTTVKALLNEYGSQGLRMIELPKMYLADLREVQRVIEGRQQKFIIFIDDLSFEDNENDFTALKAVLEGSLENKNQNAIIYATSNRRHLIKEKFSDRAGFTPGSVDDVHAGDTLQEKLSLSDRFGITVTFTAPTKKKYLEIVEGLAKKRGINVDIEVLHSEALKWEILYNGRSPRTACQFIDWMEGHNSMD